MPPLTLGVGQDLVDGYLRSWVRADVDAGMALFGEDAEVRVDPFEPALVGANAIREYLNLAAASQAHIDAEAERVWISGTTALASWHGAWTDRRTAQRTRLRGFLTIEVGDDGLISRLKSWSITRMVGVDSTLKPEPDLDLEQALQALQAVSEGTRGR